MKPVHHDVVGNATGPVPRAVVCHSGACFATCLGKSFIPSAFSNGCCLQVNDSVRSCHQKARHAGLLCFSFETHFKHC